MSSAPVAPDHIKPVLVCEREGACSAGCLHLRAGGPRQVLSAVNMSFHEAVHASVPRRHQSYVMKIQKWQICPNDL